MKYMIDFKEIIAKSIEKVLNKETNIENENKIDELKGFIEKPNNKENGDFAFPCFKLAKDLKKSPNLIAKEIKENIEFWKNRTPDICGKFFWIPYTPGVSLSKELSNLDSATLARFLFCCSYRSADGFLTKSSRKDGKPLAPKDLQALMGLSDSAARKCFKPLFENGLLILRDGSIYPNPEVISRGNIKQTKYDVNSKKIRGFYNGIQTLFEKCRDPRQHKAVGYIYKLIPWVNINYN